MSMSSRELNEWAAVLDVRSDDQAVAVLRDLMKKVDAVQDAARVLTRSLAILPLATHAKDANRAIGEAGDILYGAAASFGTHQRGL